MQMQPGCEGVDHFQHVIHQNVQGSEMIPLILSSCAENSLLKQNLQKRLAENFGR
jgi:hypothetical protein